MDGSKVTVLVPGFRAISAGIVGANAQTSMLIRIMVAPMPKDALRPWLPATSPVGTTLEDTRTAYESPPLSTEFGILADREFFLGSSLSAYAERLIEHGKFAQA